MSIFDRSARLPSRTPLPRTEYLDWCQSYPKAQPTIGWAEGEKLSADAKLFDDRAVAIDVGLRQVIEKTTALTNEQQQTAAAVVIMLVSLEVASQIVDTTRHERDLNFWASGIARLGAKFCDDFLLDL